jgi:serine/threonine protein kinase
LKHPFDSPTYFEMQKAIKERDAVPLPSSVSPFAKEIVSMCLDKNPKNRPDSEKLMKID